MNDGKPHSNVTAFYVNTLETLLELYKHILSVVCVHVIVFQALELFVKTF
jgi:hypothetical protein